MFCGNWKILVIFALAFACLPLLAAEPNPASDDFFERIGISRYASDARVLDAFLVAIKQFDGNLTALARLEEAFATIGKEESRARYRATLPPVAADVKPTETASSSAPTAGAIPSFHRPDDPLWIGTDKARALIRSIETATSADLEEIAFQIHEDTAYFDGIDRKEVNAALFNRWKQLAQGAKSPTEAVDIILAAMFTAGKFQRVMTVAQYEAIAEEIPFDSIKSRWKIFSQQLKKTAAYYAPEKSLTPMPNLMRLALLVQARAEETDANAIQRLDERIVMSRKDGGNQASASVPRRRILIEMANSPGGAQGMLERSAQRLAEHNADPDYWPELRYHLAQTTKIGLVPVVCTIACAVLKDYSGFIAGAALVGSGVVGAIGAYFTLGSLANHFIEESERRERRLHLKHTWESFRDTTTALYPDLPVPEQPSAKPWSFLGLCRSVWKAAKDE